MRIVIRGQPNHAIPVLAGIPTLLGQPTHNRGTQRFAEAFAEATGEQEGFEAKAEVDHRHGARQGFCECIEIGNASIAFRACADALPGATRSQCTEMAATSAIAKRRVRRVVENHVGQLAALAIRANLGHAVDEDLEADAAAEGEQGKVRPFVDEAEAGRGDIVEHAHAHAGQSLLQHVIECKRTQGLPAFAPDCRQGGDPALCVDRSWERGGNRLRARLGLCAAGIVADEIEHIGETIARVDLGRQQVIGCRPPQLLEDARFTIFDGNHGRTHVGATDIETCDDARRHQ
ncbi:MAG: hypothetical protein IPP82_01465 [Xanthomonadales bacterium]|nr:hypothetical protein [Xanthomonadales bacterium]